MLLFAAQKLYRRSGGYVDSSSSGQSRVSSRMPWSMQGFLCLLHSVEQSFDTAGQKAPSISSRSTEAGPFAPLPPRPAAYLVLLISTTFWPRHGPPSKKRKRLTVFGSLSPASTRLHTPVRNESRTCLGLLVRAFALMQMIFRSWQTYGNCPRATSLSNTRPREVLRFI